jgi:hypothetical protein
LKKLQGSGLDFGFVKGPALDPVPSAVEGGQAKNGFGSGVKVLLAEE